MAVGDVCTLRIIGRYQSQNIVNTLHYRIDDQGSSEQEILQQLCDGFYASFLVAWQARHIDTYTLVGLKAFGLTGAAKTPGFKSASDAGSIVGEEVPAAVCRTITLYTASAKHRRRGRLMLSGSAVAHFNTNDGGVTSAEVALLDTLGSNLDNGISITPDTFALVIPASGVDPVEVVVDTKGRTTPSIVKSRRIRQFLIG